VAGPNRFNGVRIANNVMLDIGRGRPTNRTLGWGLDIQEWDNGAVSGNLFLHNASDTVNNVYAINVNGAAGARKIAISDNVVFGMKTNGTLVDFEGTLDSVAFRNNALQSQNIAARLLSVSGFTGLSFSANAYYSTRPANEWFAIGGTNTNLTNWVTRSGETGVQGTAAVYPDPNRTLETYHASLGKQASFSAFIDEVRKQSRANWRSEYTAAAINDWIRAGFGITMSVAPKRAPSARYIRFTSQDRTPVRIYTINGRLLRGYNRYDQQRRSLPSGLYLIGINRTTMVRSVNGRDRRGR
jgi:hypothetical protein